MAVDAALTRKNLTKLHRAGIAAIPIHDSNLVPAQYADKTTEVMEETLQKHLRISSSNLVALSVPVGKHHQGDSAELVLQNGPRVVVGWSPGAVFLPVSVVVVLRPDLGSLVVVSSFYSGSVIGLKWAA
jgi:hypothetical protein